MLWDPHGHSCAGRSQLRLAPGPSLSTAQSAGEDFSPRTQAGTGQSAQWLADVSRRFCFSRLPRMIEE